MRFGTNSLAVLLKNPEPIRDGACSKSGLFHRCSFDSVRSLGADAAAALGGQPAGVSVPPADAAPPSGPAAEHQRAAQTAVAATQHAGRRERRRVKSEAQFAGLKPSRMFSSSVLC